MPQFPDSSGSFPRNLMSGVGHVSTTCTLVFLMLYEGLVTTDTEHFRNSWRSSGQPSLHTESLAQPAATSHILQGWEYLREARIAAPLGSHCSHCVCQHQVEHAVNSRLGPLLADFQRHLKSQRSPQSPADPHWCLCDIVSA